MTTDSIINFYTNQDILGLFAQRIEKARKAIRKASHIVVGAGAGMSTAAGLEYTGKRFTDNFQPFIRKYGMEDLYTSSFYPFETEEEKWAYWAKHISLNRYETPATHLYRQLYQLLQNRSYFIITTNADGQFEKAGVDPQKLFCVQGDYAYFQCKHACHNTLYHNQEAITSMLRQTTDCRILSHLVPVCPICGKEMDVNIRKDSHFVQDKKWYESKNRYQTFLTQNITDTPFLYLELGVGYNTPGIIRYPFEKMLYNNPNATLIRINKDFPTGIAENRRATIPFSEDISDVFSYINP